LTDRNKQPIKAVLILLALCLPVIAQTRTITGKVVGVTDGDTITVLDASRQQHKIRLDGIDAPESSQAFGQRAKESLSDLVFGKTVTVTSTKTDRYGRIVGKVMLDGRDINLEQIKRGMAWFFRKYAHELSRDDARAYEQAEADAIAKRRGLWSEPGPIAPWELRAAKRNEAETQPAPTTGEIIGNRNSYIYHRPDCPDYTKVSERNRVYFKTADEAEKAGYRMARNCPPGSSR